MYFLRDQMSSKIDTKNFKIINAGFPKTGTKSYTKAMRMLGFSVADVAQTMEYFQDDWVNYIDQKIPLDDVIRKYDEHGINATSDLPFNGLAVNGYDRIKGCKIILTVRDNEDVWLNSYRRHFNTQATRHGKYVGIIESFLWCRGLAGKVVYNLVHIGMYYRISVLSL